MSVGSGAGCVEHWFLLLLHSYNTDLLSDTFCRLDTTKRRGQNWCHFQRVLHFRIGWFNLYLGTKKSDFVSGSLRGITLTTPTRARSEYLNGKCFEYSKYIGNNKMKTEYDRSQVAVVYWEWLGNCSHFKHFTNQFVSRPDNLLHNCWKSEINHNCKMLENCSILLHQPCE